MRRGAGALSGARAVPDAGVEVAERSMHRLGSRTLPTVCLAGCKRLAAGLWSPWVCGHTRWSRPLQWRGRYEEHLYVDDCRVGSKSCPCDLGLRPGHLRGDRLLPGSGLSSRFGVGRRLVRGPARSGGGGVSRRHSVGERCVCGVCAPLPSLLPPRHLV